MPVDKQSVTFGRRAERSYGYSQAVRVGDTAYVSGQIALDEDGKLVGIGDMGAQMRAAYDGIARALAPLGGDLANVVEEVLFVTDIAAASKVAGEVRAEVYGGTFEVASTLVQVAALAGPDFLIEIRCTARL